MPTCPELRRRHCRCTMPPMAVPNLPALALRTCSRQRDRSGAGHLQYCNSLYKQCNQQLMTTAQTINNCFVFDPVPPRNRAKTTNLGDPRSILLRCFGAHSHPRSQRASPRRARTAVASICEAVQGNTHIAITGFGRCVVVTGQSRGCD